MKPIRVVVVDDHPLIHSGIEQTLEPHEHIEIVGNGYDGASIMPLLKVHQPDILLLDHQMPERQEDGPRILDNTFQAQQMIRRIIRAFPDLRIVIFSHLDSPITIKNAVLAGACGYVVKGDWVSTKIAEVIASVCRGDVFVSPTGKDKLARANISLANQATLSSRETEVLTVLHQNPGRHHALSARELGISPNTLNNHLSNIRKLLEVDSTQEAIDVCVANGII